MSIYYKIFREYRGASHSPALVGENPRTLLETWVQENGGRGKVWMLRYEVDGEREVLVSRGYAYPKILFQGMTQVGL